MRLLSLAPEEIGKLIEAMEKEVNQIKNDALKLSWYMRGGVSYSEIMNLSHVERQMIGKIVEDNLETTKNTKLPFF